MSKDLGTYHLRVELEDGRGWIQEWATGKRYTGGTHEATKLDARKINPPYEKEEDVLFGMKWQYLNGNYSCDCNKTLFLSLAYNGKEPSDECGATLKIKRLTAIRPDFSEVVIYEK